MRLPVAATCSWRHVSLTTSSSSRRWRAVSRCALPSMILRFLSTGTASCRTGCGGRNASSTRASAGDGHHQQGWQNEFEDHFSIIDRINHMTLQRTVIATMQAFRQRGVKGNFRRATSLARRSTTPTCLRQPRRTVDAAGGGPRFGNPRRRVFRRF